MKNRITLIVEEIEKKNYHLFVEISISRHRSRLLIDTGASRTVFDRAGILRFVKKKQLKALDATSVGLGTSEVKTEAVTLTTLRFGALVIKKMEVAVLDLSHVNRSYTMLGLAPIDGVLGSDFFMKHKAVISYNKKKLTLQ